MIPKTISIFQQTKETFLAILFGCMNVCLKLGKSLSSFSPLPHDVLIDQPHSHVILIHKGEAIDLVKSIESSLILKSKEGCFVSFRLVDSFLVVQSEGLEMVQE